jgi:2Fe-2S ferredoxin
LPRITFVSSAGSRSEFEASPGSTAMVVAKSNGVPGIEAECGGSLSCGTCHVYVDPADVEKVPPASDQELEMLDLVAADQKPNSRLSCQIVLSDDLDGLVIHVPETQY